DNKTYRLDPAQPIAMPAAADVAAMAPVPGTGYPGVRDADEFNRAYTDMVNRLQAAWTSGDAAAGLDALGEAVGLMQGSLPGPARRLMETPRDPVYGPGNYGPTFKYLGAAPPPPAALGAAPAAAPVPAVGATVPIFARIKQILDEAVQGRDIGAHGP